MTKLRHQNRKWDVCRLLGCQLTAAAGSKGRGASSALVLLLLLLFMAADISVRTSRGCLQQGRYEAIDNVRCVADVQRWIVPPGILDSSLIA